MMRLLSGDYLVRRVLLRLFDAQLRCKISLHLLYILLAIRKSVKISLSEIVNI